MKQIYNILRIDDSPGVRVEGGGGEKGALNSLKIVTFAI
jgi:hypothetical protein